MRIGLFGGTFDPPHIGHLIVAQDAWFRLRLDRLVFVPAASPPHKQDRDVTPAPLRLALLRAAVADDDRFDIDALELRRAGPSYTVDTLRAYHAADPAAELFLILGADQYDELDTWRETAEIRRLVTIAVLSRDGRAATDRRGAGERLLQLEVTRIDVSATDIRRRVASGEPIRYLVPPAVEELIRREGLYGATALVRHE